jgi:hypothetical protein
VDLSSQLIGQADQPFISKVTVYEVGNEILTGLSIEMIETIFVDWMNRLQRLIDGNGEYVS